MDKVRKKTLISPCEWGSNIQNPEHIPHNLATLTRIMLEFLANKNQPWHNILGECNEW